MERACVRYHEWALTKRRIIGNRSSLLKCHFLRRDAYKDPVVVVFLTYLFAWGDTCVCIGRGEHMCGHIPVHAHGDQRKALVHHSVLSPDTAWSSLFLSNPLVSASSTHFLGPELQMCAATPHFFYVDAQDLDSCPHASLANTFTHSSS